MQPIVHLVSGTARQGRGAASIGRFVASALVFASSLQLAVAAQVQHVSPRAAPMPRVDAKLDPALLEDAEQLAANGFVREPARIRSNMRVVVELARDAEDVDFEATTRGDLLAEIQYRTALRQEVFQGRVEGTLTPRERQGWNLLFPIDLQYMVAGEVDDLETLRAIAALDDVRYVWRDNPLEMHDYEGTTLTGSAAAAASGWTGAGVGVAVIDTQFDLLHPELGGSTTLPNAVVKAGANYSGTPAAGIHSQTWDNCYHGTGVASIVRRYAPGAHIYALPVFPDAYDSNLANAINWCVANRNGANGRAPIRIINMSLGAGRTATPTTDGVVHVACGNARANGILCIASAGNYGWTNALNAWPAGSTNVISVGSTWDATNAPFSSTMCSDPSRVVDERTCYSNTASFLSIYAPSEQVICARCTGGTFALGGTSSASPALAGITAQLLQARPHLRGDMQGVIDLYRATGVAVLGDTGKRRVNLTAALQQSLTSTRTLWATSVPETSGTEIPWANESWAGGTETCNDCNTAACQYSTNSTNGNTTPLRAADFQAFTLPAGQRITNVKVEVSARYNANTTANIGFRAFAPAHGLNSNWRNSPSFSSGTLCAPRLGSTGDITSLSSNWTAAMINDLQFEVRRQANLNGNSLRVVSMKLVVTTSY